MKSLKFNLVDQDFSKIYFLSKFEINNVAIKNKNTEGIIVLKCFLKNVN